MKNKLSIIIATSIFIALPSYAKPALKADYIFYNGAIFTASDKAQNPSAIVIKNGIIQYIGNDKTALKYSSKQTKKHNLNGNTLMPGIIDAHMHPQSAGLKMAMCSLNYEALTIDEMNAKIQSCLDKEKNAKDDDWLVVINWFEQEMKPTGFSPTYKDLVNLKTKRPVYIKNSFGHAAIMNQRAMEIIDLKNQKDRAGGIIVRDKEGNPTGRLEDAARDIVSSILPQPNEAQNLEAARLALKAMNAQGISTILDAYTDIETMSAYQTLRKKGELTIRPHFAVLIDPDKEPDLNKNILEITRQRKLFDEGAQKITPSLSVHTAKFFMDGTVALPSLTGALKEPYFENHGTHEHPKWEQGNNYGIKPYIKAEDLAQYLIRLADIGIDSHIHADGDNAVRETIDAAMILNEKRPNHKMRTSIAHAELVDPIDFPLFGMNNILPVLSFQWGKPAADTWEGSKDVLGPKRFAVFEPQSLLNIYGAKIVFGSDWPVDPLNEWLALEVALTRMADDKDREKYPMPLGDAPPLDLYTALKAMTINAAYSLHVENVTGSLEVGKFADLIVLDRDLFKTKPNDISLTKVKLTMVGGKIVYENK